MDPLTHLVITAALVGKERKHMVAGVLPDLPWYLLYPIWVASRTRSSDHGVSALPMPPQGIRTLHYATHSLLTLGVACAVARLLSPRSSRVCLAWLIHILTDVPSHSRERMAPRLAWPLSSWSFDGFSWADWLWRHVSSLARAAHRVASQDR